MLLGLGSSYRGRDERLDRQILTGVLAVIAGGMVFLLAAMFLSFPEWITPRRFTTWLFVAGADEAPATLRLQIAGRSSLLPPPGSAEVVLSDSSSPSLPAVGDPTNDLSIAAGVLEASRAVWIFAAASPSVSFELPPPASSRDPWDHVPIEVIDDHPPVSVETPVPEPVGGSPPAETAPVLPGAPVDTTPGPGTVDPPAQSPGPAPEQPRQPGPGQPGEKPANPSPGQGKANPPGHNR